MSTGPLNEQEFTQSIRAIGYKKRSGSLDIIFPGKHIILYFLNGKLVEATEHDVTPVTATYRFLLSKGILEGDPGVSFQTYAELISETEMSPEIVQRGLEEKITDFYLSVPLNAGGMFSLQTGVPDLERDFMSSISTGQMLLDYVAIQDEESTFNTRCQGKDKWFLSTGLKLDDVIKTQGISRDTLEALLEILKTPTSFEEIQNKLFASKLSSYLHLKFSLDHGLISFTDPVTTQAVSGISNGDVGEEAPKEAVTLWSRVMKGFAPPPIGDAELRPDIIVQKGRFSLVAGYAIAMAIAWIRYLL